MNKMKTIGQKIKLLRKKQGVSQENLSFELNISRQIISKWENDSVRPTSDNLIALCAYFNVDSNYFMSESNKVTENDCAATTVPSISHKKTVAVLISIIVSTVIFLVSLIVGISVIIINEQEDTGFETVSHFNFDWLKIICFVIALLALVSTIVLIIYRCKHKKSKM